MNNELLNKILPYAGYGLKACYEDSIVNVLPSSSGTNRISVEMLLTPNRHTQTYEYKPVLFPPDCLKREIETEHGKEVPLIEMAKIAFPYASKWEIKNNCAVSGIVLVSMNENGSISVHRIISSDGYTSPNETYNQWQLFQYLYSRHIAFNLEPDKYVSVKSLENNPYK